MISQKIGMLRRHLSSHTLKICRAEHKNMSEKFTVWNEFFDIAFSVNLGRKNNSSRSLVISFVSFRSEEVTLLIN